MAPLITITVQYLLGFIGLRQQAAVQKAHTNTAVPLPAAQGLSTISWGYNRMDIYGQSKEDYNITHKWWDGYQWSPSWNTTEDLGEGFREPPIAIARAKDKMDLFARDNMGGLGHRYWDGSAWQPASGKGTEESDIETLGGSFYRSFNKIEIAVTSWSEDRIDIFAIDDDAQLTHKYWDGSSWQPSKNFESLGGHFSDVVGAVSWYPGHLAVFAINDEGKLLYIYFDGTKWSEFEDLEIPPASKPTVIAWGSHRYDIFGILGGNLYHKAWDGSRWLDLEGLGGNRLKEPVAASSWAEGRIDIVALSDDGGYYYKYFDGTKWVPHFNPDEKSDDPEPGLISKGGSFSSAPSLVSWGENRLDIFGITDDSQLGHQTWYGSGWYPESGFEKLGGEYIAV